MHFFQGDDMSLPAESPNLKTENCPTTVTQGSRGRQAARKSRYSGEDWVVGDKEDTDEDEEYAELLEGKDSQFGGTDADATELEEDEEESSEESEEESSSEEGSDDSSATTKVENAAVEEECPFWPDLK